MHKRTKILITIAGAILLVGVLALYNTSAVQVQGGGGVVVRPPVSRAEEEPIEGRAAGSEAISAPVAVFEIQELSQGLAVGDRVKTALAGIPGILKIHNDFRDGHADVTFDPVAMGANAEECVLKLQKALEHAGLTVKDKAELRLPPASI